MGFSHSKISIWDFKLHESVNRNCVKIRRITV
jgi:hypothetical protein